MSPAPNLGRRLLSDELLEIRLDFCITLGVLDNRKQLIAVHPEELEESLIHGAVVVVFAEV